WRLSLAGIQQPDLCAYPALYRYDRYRRFPAGSPDGNGRSEASGRMSEANRQMHKSKPMPLGFVGRTPRSAADALVGFLGVACSTQPGPGSGADEGDRPTVRARTREG